MGREFPDRFIWGAATSSYQIEGAAFEDGRGVSIWDTFCRMPGRVVKSEHGDVACDHYHRYPEDVALMSELNLAAYRFSIAWPRIFPNGDDRQPLAAGLDFYDRLVDALLEKGITPWATLYHWDMPLALELRGGWRNRATAEAFARYSRVCAEHLGDRVKHWITINEPWCVAVLGHELGEHAPGLKDRATMLSAAHHVLLAHGLAVPEIRAAVPDATVGITLNLCPADPASDSAVDQEATRKFDGWFNRWYLDPCFGRGYPSDTIEDYRREGIWPEEGSPDWLKPGDLEAMGVECEFLGLNYYSRGVIRDEESKDNLPPSVVASEEVTDMGWEIAPDSLRQLLVHLGEEYGLPVVITENGSAWPTGPDSQGRIRDERRVDYLIRHLQACRNAIDEGAPLIGYFAWSLMDNFEWAFGYDKRFGIVHVDYETLERTPKDSARVFAEVCRTRGASVPDTP